MNSPDILKILIIGYRRLFSGELQLGSYKESKRSYNPHSHSMSIIADPIVEWLGKQEKNSITQLQLFSKATAIYGDPLTALGVIGFVFDSERTSIANRRNQAVLGSRLTPLFSIRNFDTIGTNYQFWAYLNIALLNKGAVTTEHLFTYLWECVKQNDLLEYSADNHALELGSSVFAEVMRSSVR